MKTTYVLCSAGALVGLSVGAGCWGFAGSHCGNLNGDQTCAERGGGMYCSACSPENDGCSDQMPSEGCHFAGLGVDVSTGGGGETTGTTQTVDTSNSTLAVDATSEVTSADGTTLALTGDSGTTTELPECRSDDNCQNPTSYCREGTCVACSETEDPNGVCRAENPSLPLCVNDVCVSCEDGLMLVDRMGSCLPCTEHDQCSSGACDIFEGTCFDADRVVEVSHGEEFGSITAGLAELQMRGLDRRGERRGVLVLHQHGNVADIDFSEAAAVEITSSNHDAVAFMAGDFPTWTNWTNTGAASPTLTVADPGVRVYLNGIRILNDTAAPGGQSLRCDDAHVDIRHSRLVENIRGGIVADGHCEVVMQNSFVGVNPDDGDADGVDAFQIVSANVQASILYSTLGSGPGNGAAALSCVAGATVEVRNSLLVSLANTPELDCPGTMLTTSATEAGGLGDMSVDWFVDYDIGNFHLSNLALIGLAVAAWQFGDPPVDIDGDPRVLWFGRAGADGP